MYRPIGPNQTAPFTAAKQGLGIRSAGNAPTRQHLPGHRRPRERCPALGASAAGGKFNGPAGGGKGPWRLTDAAAVITASLAGGRDLVIDYDHQSEYSARPGVGGTAPAAGWITQLEHREDGIWGQVTWTEAGAAAVAAREYRYLSPVFQFDAAGQAKRLLRAGLTNTPALNLTAVAAEGARRPTRRCRRISICAQKAASPGWLTAWWTGAGSPSKNTGPAACGRSNSQCQNWKGEPHDSRDHTAAPYGGGTGRRR
jgi:hypothetical protein